MYTMPKMPVLLLLFMAFATNSDDISAQQAEKTVKYDNNPGGLSWLGDMKLAQTLDEQGQIFLESGEFLEAARLFEQATYHSKNMPSRSGYALHYKAAIAYVFAGKHDKAIELLGSAVDDGAWLADLIANSNELSPLRDINRFQAIVAKAQANFQAYKEKYSDPDTAPLIFDDVKRFWQAYDLAEETSSPARKAAIYRKYYIGEGTSGLVDYHWIKTLSSERLVRKIEEASAYYTGIRDRTLTAAKYETDIRNGFHQLKILYPEAYFPPVTFVIGRLNSGGTAGLEGMLIGLDVWSWTEGVSLDGISPGFQKIVTGFDLSNLPWVVVHEQVHAMQSYTAPPSLLLAALQEGTADFLANLALPNAKRNAYHEWGLKNEAMVWQRFLKDMDGKDTSDWIANNNDTLDEDWHADLGYFVGARIAEAYYEKAQVKQKAIRDLLIVTDPKSILKISGYGESFVD